LDPRDLDEEELGLRERVLLDAERGNEGAAAHCGVGAEKRGRSKKKIYRSWPNDPDRAARLLQGKRPDAKEKERGLQKTSRKNKATNNSYIISETVRRLTRGNCGGVEIRTDLST